MKSLNKKFIVLSFFALALVSCRPSPKADNEIPLIPVSLAINHQTEAKIPAGWPVMVEIVSLDEGDQHPIVLSVRDEKGSVQKWKWELLEGQWILSPDQSRKLKVGLYHISALTKKGNKVTGQSGAQRIEILKSSDLTQGEKEKVLLMAEFWMLKKNNQEAQEVLSQFLKKKSGDADALIMLSDVFAKTGQKAEALELLNQALSQFEGDGVPKNIAQKHRALLVEFLKSKSENPKKEI